MKVGITYGNPAKLAAYSEAVRAAGLSPLPLHSSDPYSLSGLQGLVLSGGADLNPALYGQTPAPETGEPDDPRDEMEASLLRAALDANLPVLAICRGCQLFNVVHGGTLVQHLPTSATHCRQGESEAHHVSIRTETRLASITGPGPHVVNSSHHQAIDVCPSTLVVAARSCSDDVIEAVERPGCRFAIAIQWHPEQRIDTHHFDRALFEAFAAAVWQG